MSPVIADGDRVLIGPISPELLRIGDIVKFSLDGEFRLHRLIRRRLGSDGSVTLELHGDNAASPDPPVEPLQVIGVALAVERGGRLRRLDTPWARAHGRLMVARLRWQARTTRRMDARVEGGDQPLG